MKHVFLLLCMVLTCGCGDSIPDTLIESGYDEQEMEDAIVRARGEVDAFIAELNNPTGSDHAVKAPIQDGDATEHFWLTDVSFEDGQFTGRISNDPGMVTNVENGQEWTVGKFEISDWMYYRDGKMYGNYTMRPLLKAMPEDEADRYRSLLAEP